MGGKRENRKKEWENKETTLIADVQGFTDRSNALTSDAINFYKESGQREFLFRLSLLADWLVRETWIDQKHFDTFLIS